MKKSNMSPKLSSSVSGLFRNNKYFRSYWPEVNIKTIVHAEKTLHFQKRLSAKCDIIFYLSKLTTLSKYSNVMCIYYD